VLQQVPREADSGSRMCGSSSLGRWRDLTRR
jgi:hypothetical protein